MTPLQQICFWFGVLSVAVGSVALYCGYFPYALLAGTFLLASLFRELLSKRSP